MEVLTLTAAGRMSILSRSEGGVRPVMGARPVGAPAIGKGAMVSLDIKPARAATSQGPRPGAGA